MDRERFRRWLAEGLAVVRNDIVGFGEEEGATSVMTRTPSRRRASTAEEREEEKQGDGKGNEYAFREAVRGASFSN